MTTVFGSNVTKMPVMLCGRPVWVSEDGGYGSNIKRVWIHTAPGRDAALTFAGSSLIEGDQKENLAHLEGLCRSYIESLPPIPATLRKRWESDVANRAKPDWLIELEFDAVHLALKASGKREITLEEVNAFVEAEKRKRGYDGPHLVCL